MTPVADPTLAFERKLLGRQDGVIIGCDEVGRGALAGPVAVGLCVVEVRRSTRVPKGLRDSKMLSEQRREELAPVAGRWGVAHAVGYASAFEIDALGITACLGLAGQRALTELIAAGVDVQSATVLLDGNFDYLSRAISTPLTVRTRIKADRDCASVAAASVLSKVARDRMMIEHDDVFPGYGWARNKGYGSEEHRSGILSLGATDLHRHTWLSSFVNGDPTPMLDGFEEFDAARADGSAA
ncbi:ribonuclease HII [Herbiconiux daphne]|uniref:Ribonuclease HII n=1 Tax=Herbiconiux daphne TaxID=2970914 RepID=A0ABT2GYJ0_9MICO|nr:ribonuclease HII [Herbiconiux daphne]MCS5733020.1 ribonuclease HII [Herbiconiux daphne]